MKPVANIIRGLSQKTWERMGPKTYHIWRIARVRIMNPLDSDINRVKFPVLFFFEDK